MKRPGARKRVRSGGFSLIEVMVSMGILAFGLLGIAAIQVYGIRGNSGGQHLSEASAVARNRIEELSRTGFNSATLNDSGNAWVNTTTIQTTSQAYTRTERITNEGADLKELEIRVAWSDSLRPNRSLVVSSKKLREPDE